MGRPSLLTPDTADKICEAIRAGVPYKYAAGANGISYESFNNWRRRGRDALAISEEHELEVPADEQPYVQFLQDVQRARDAGIAALVVIVRQHAARDYRAALALLAIRDPAVFAQRSRHDVFVTPVVGEELPDERGPVEAVEVIPDQARAEALLGVLSEAGLLADVPTTE